MTICKFHACGTIVLNNNAFDRSVRQHLAVVSQDHTHDCIDHTLAATNDVGISRLGASGAWKGRDAFVERRFKVDGGDSQGREFTWRSYKISHDPKKESFKDR